MGWEAARLLPQFFIPEATGRSGPHASSSQGEAVVCLLVMIVLLHISVHARACGRRASLLLHCLRAVDKTIDIPSRTVGLINAVWGWDY